MSEKPLGQVVGKSTRPLALVFESRFEGHTLGYARDLAHQTSVAGFEVALALNIQSQTQPEYLQIEENEFNHYWCDSPITNYKSPEGGLLDLQNISELYKELKPEKIIVPSADSIMSAMGTCAESRAIAATLPPMDLIGHWYNAGAFPTGVRSAQSILQNLHEVHRLRRHRMYSCDPFASIGAGRWVFHAGGCRPPRFISLPLGPQYAGNQAEARGMFDLNSERHYVVAVGGISPRKECGILLEAIGRKDWPEDIGVMCMGRIHDSLKSLLNHTRRRFGDRLVVVEDFLSEEEFSAAFVAADAVWSLKRTKGVSSTSLHAAKARRPSIVSKSDASATWLQSRIGPGIQIALDSHSVTRGVAEVMNCPEQTEEQRTFLERMTDPNGFVRILESS